VSKKSEPRIAELLLRGAREAAAHATWDPEVARRSTMTRRPLTARDVRLASPSTPSPSRIRGIRDGLDLSQSLFADLLNVSASTVRAWEQGQRVPDGPSLRLLEIAEHRPAALMEMAIEAESRPRRSNGRPTTEPSKKGG
jgi:putative transcriptional regulator